MEKTYKEKCMETVSNTIEKIDLLTDSSQELSSTETALFYHAVSLKLLRRFTLKEAREIIQKEFQEIISGREK